jgi:hypothetical protein
MGACCAGKEHKVEIRHEEINTRQFKSTFQDLNSNLPEIDFEVEKTDFAKELHEVIKKYAKNEDKMLNNIITFSIDQLWNICKSHNDDFTASEYLLLDVRDYCKRKENFLKKFKMINYTLQEMKMLSSNALIKFKKYILGKSIIIVSDGKAIETVEETVTFLIDLESRLKLCLVDSDLEVQTPSNKHLISFLEAKHFHSFPYLFLSMKYFPRMNSNNYVFINFITNETAFKPCENSINSFRQVYNINTVIDITNKQNNSKEKGMSYITLIVKNLGDLILLKDNLIKIADTIRDKVKSNSCCLINITNIPQDSEIILYVTFYLALRILNIHLKKLRTYAYENFTFIPKIKEHCNTNQNK